MEVAEQSYEWGTPSKTPIREYANCVSHGRKQKGGVSTFPTNTEMVRAGKRKKNYAGHLSDQTTGGKTCLLHIPENSTEECKVLNDYSKRHAVKRPHNEKEACSGGNKLIGLYKIRRKGKNPLILKYYQL